MQALAELTDRKHSEGLTADEGLRHALLVEEHGEGPDKAFELLGQLSRDFPEHSDIGFIFAARMLQRGDEAGVALLSPKIGPDPGRSLAACELIRDHFWAKGDQEKAFDWQERAEPYREQLAAMQAERNTIRTTDTFDPHGMSDSELQKLIAEFSRLPEIKSVYVVKKRLSHDTAPPLYVVGFILRRTWWRRIKSDQVVEVRNRIAEEIAFPHEAMIFNIQGTNAEFKSALSKVKGSRIL